MGHKLNLTHELNSELFEWISANPYKEIGRLNAERVAARHKPKWRLRDRLTERNIVQLGMALQTGMRMKDLADHYGISVKSVRKLKALSVNHP